MATGRSGRTRKPTRLKVIQGTDRPDRMNPDEPQPMLGIGDPPEHLSEAAKREWRETGEKLVRLGIATEIDAAAFALYCQAYGRWAEAEMKLQEGELVIDTPTGYPVQSPWLQIANKAHEQMLRALVEFGMTPSSRTRVKTAAKPNAADPLEEFVGD